MLTLFAVLAASTLAAGAGPGPETGVVEASRGDAAGLLEGVGSIPTVGTAGLVSVWSPRAFAVVLGGSGGQKAPIVAAGDLGEGRVMAWAHGWDSADAAGKLGTGRLLTNAARWLSREGPGRKARVAVLGGNLAGWLAEHGVDAVAVKGGDDLAGQLAGCTALFCGKSDLTEKEVAAALAFVRSGGGFSCFACPWGWAQVRKKAVADLPLNRVLAPAGIALADGYGEPTEKGAFAAAAEPGPEFNASRALDLLEKGDEKGGRKGVRAQASATTVLAARTMPAGDEVLRPRLRGLLAGRGKGIVPTEKHPLREADALDRVLLTLQVEDLSHAEVGVGAVGAHPAAVEFPGALPEGAERGSVSVALEPVSAGGKWGWISTGAYAGPGEPVTVKGAEGKGLRVRIGCHQDDLWALKEWKRVPAIDRSWALDGPEVRVANAFGGPVYIEVPEGWDRRVAVTIEGVAAAPLYVLGKTTREQWAAERAKPGPWAELVCDRVVLSVPTAVARKVEDPAAVMGHWVKVMDAIADLAGRPHERARPERYVADVQISAGYMHSGYPIMTHLDAASFMTDLKGLTDQGWGPYHEMGHNHQDGMWTFEGTGEVTCNLFTLYVLETVCGVEHAETGRVLNEEGAAKRARYLAEGAKFEKWKQDPFLALQMYAMVKREFGWAPFKRVFAEYRDLPRGERPKGDDQERDQWMVRLSRAVGRNLGPFFEAWGVPTSAAARAEVGSLPGWMPEDMGLKKS